MTITVTHPDGRQLALSYDALTTSGAAVLRTQLITVRGAWYPAETPIEIWMHSSPELVAGTTTDTRGSFAASFYPPPHITPGDHILQILSGQGESVTSTVIGITIVDDSDDIPFPNTELPTTGYSGANLQLGTLLIAAGVLVSFLRRSVWR